MGLNMDTQLSCYKIHACCGTHCDLFGVNPDEPCWGDVNVIEEIYDEEGESHQWIHRCKGHEDTYDGGVYKQK